MSLSKCTAQKRSICDEMMPDSPQYKTSSWKFEICFGSPFLKNDEPEKINCAENIIFGHALLGLICFSLQK